MPALAFGHGVGYSMRFVTSCIWRRLISVGFTPDERKRFHNLLKLAAESPFEGERDAALAAAKRLAKKVGMSLEDAAADQSGREEVQSVVEERARARNKDYASRPWTADDSAPAGFAEQWARGRKGAADGHSWRATDQDKKRWTEARDEARKRGLDEAERERAEKPAPRRQQAQRRSSRRMHPPIHARSLLRETSFSIEEIASITELSPMEIMGIKLKMRTEPPPKRGNRGRRARG